jgi:ribosomal protein L37AE/L43A
MTTAAEHQCQIDPKAEGIWTCPDCGRRFRRATAADLRASLELVATADRRLTRSGTR